MFSRSSSPSLSSDNDSELSSSLNEVQNNVTTRLRIRVANIRSLLIFSFPCNEFPKTICGEC